MNYIQTYPSHGPKRVETTGQNGDVHDHLSVICRQIRKKNFAIEDVRRAFRLEHRIVEQVADMCVCVRARACVCKRHLNYKDSGENVLAQT